MTVEVFVTLPAMNQILTVPREFEIIKDRYVLFMSFLIPFWYIGKYLIAFSIKNNIFYTRREEPFKLAKAKDY